MYTYIIPPASFTLSLNPPCLSSPLPLINPSPNSPS